LPQGTTYTTQPRGPLFQKNSLARPCSLTPGQESAPGPGSPLDAASPRGLSARRAPRHSTLFLTRARQTSAWRRKAYQGSGRAPPPLQTFAAAHPGLGGPEQSWALLQAHMSAPPSKHPTARAPGGARPATRWTSDAMDCRATNFYTASFPGKAGFSRRHDGLRDRIYREAVRAGLLANREYAPPCRDARSHGRAAEGPRCRVRGRAPLRSRGG
jgi:hypothetical protein